MANACDQQQAGTFKLCLTGIKVLGGCKEDILRKDTPSAEGGKMGQESYPVLSGLCLDSIEEVTEK